VPGSRLPPAPAAGTFSDGEPAPSRPARRERQDKPGRDGRGTGTPLAVAVRLLPTPDTGTSPNGHGRRGGRPGNGRQSGKSLGAVVRILAAAGAEWGEYEPAVRRWEEVLGRPAPPPSEPGPDGRPRLSAAFAEWMMGIPGRVTTVPGLPRTAQLAIIGNGAVPRQATAALRLLARAAAVPGAPPGTGTGTGAAA
jgi:DNA (cytosine-5)-methyltransferase 1